MPEADIGTILVYTLLTPLRWLLALWWLWVFLLLLPIAKGLWREYRVMRYKRRISWATLEILMPREVRKSPKAMEQVLAQIYSLRNAPSDMLERYWDGEVTLWFSLEIASFGGDIHFFVRTPVQYRRVVESYIYANYVDVEVVESADYVERMPEEVPSLYRMGLEIFGMELKFGRGDMYPIRTYPAFESVEEEKSLDPFSAIVEVLSKVKKGEQVWLQLVISAVGGEWYAAQRKMIEELKLKTTQIIRLKKGDRLEETIIPRSPGQTEILESIERKLTKGAFGTIIRFFYIAPRTKFDRQLVYRGLRAAFAQYSAQDLNFFIANNKTRTTVRWINFPHFFIKKRAEGRKQRLWQNYRLRDMPKESRVAKVLNSHPFYFDNKSVAMVLNTEELATLFHPPSYLVLTAPFLKRVEARRLGPPAGLEIFGDEESDDLSAFAVPKSEEERPS